MEKEFVPYTLALRMKQLGFDYNILGFYYDKNLLEHCCGDTKVKDLEKDEVAAPTFSQAFRWFREKYGLFAEITLWGDGLGYTSMIKEIKQEEFIEIYQKCIVDTGLPIWMYEKAELACLEKLIEIVESKLK